MTDAHARDLIAIGKDIRNALIRIATALEQANANDPLAAIERAIAVEQLASSVGSMDIRVDDALRSIDQAQKVLSDLPPGVPPEEAYRFRRGG